MNYDEIVEVYERVEGRDEANQHSINWVLVDTTRGDLSKRRGYVFENQSMTNYSSASVLTTRYNPLIDIEKSRFKIKGKWYRMTDDPKILGRNQDMVIPIDRIID